VFSWLQTFVAPFVTAFKGMFWHDTIEIIIPPTTVPIDISYIPDPEFKALIIGLTFGTSREYDPATGTIGNVLYSTDVGIYHCLPPDELVCIVGEGPIPAGEVYDRVINGEALYVASLDDGKMVASKIISVNKHKAMKLVEVHAGTRRITVTPNHPLLTIDGDLNVKWKFAGELRKGDFIAVPTRLPTLNEVADARTMKLLGMIFGDGSVTRKCISFSNKDRGVIEELSTLSEEVFKVKPKIYYHDKNGAYTAHINSVDLVKTVTNHYGFPLSPKTRLPKAVWRADVNSVRSFIEGFEVADAFIDDRERVRLVVGEKEKLVGEMMYLATAAGYIPYKVRQKQNFPHRRHDYMYSVYYNKSGRRRDDVPYIYQFIKDNISALAGPGVYSRVCMSRNKAKELIELLPKVAVKLRSIVDMETAWFRVTEVKQLDYDGEVIDVETETGNLVAGESPFITHNSTSGYMDWHWDPFVESILKTNPYPQLLWASKEKPYYLRVVNKTNKYVHVEATFWAIKFPKTVPCPIYGECDPEDLFAKYMQGVTELLIASNKVGPVKIAETLEKLAEKG